MWGGGGGAELVGVRTWNSEDEGNREAYFVGVWWSAYVLRSCGGVVRCSEVRGCAISL